MSLALVPGYDRPGDVLALLDEYTDMLIAGDPLMAEYLAVQHYDREVHDLRHKYGPPAGRLYLALWDGAVAGCVALRRESAQAGEMKRLFVRPAYRGRGIGAALMERILSDARAIGYERVVLDTLPFLKSAIALYRARGFEDIPPYNVSPIANPIYLGLELRSNDPEPV